MTYEDIIRDIKSGLADRLLPELGLALSQRQAQLDKWQPLNDLMSMLREIEDAASTSPEGKAQAGAVLHTTLVKKYAEHADPAVRGLASGVRHKVLTDLLGMPTEQADKALTWTPQSVEPADAMMHDLDRDLDAIADEIDRAATETFEGRAATGGVLDHRIKEVKRKAQDHHLWDVIAPRCKQIRSHLLITLFGVRPDTAQKMADQPW